jgi:ATP-dependent Clp protease protease subunit
MTQKRQTIRDRSLLKDRSVFIFREINESVAYRVIRDLRYLVKQNHDPISIVLHCDGGCVDGGAAILDEIELIKQKEIIVKTIVQGKAYSYAAFICALGSPGYRYATPNSSLMIHECSTELPADYLGKQEEYTKHVKKQMDVIMKLVATACKKGSKAKYQQFIADINKSMWMTAKEAINYGLIDEIYTAELDG